MNFPPGYDPSMLNNVNVDQMKMASDMFANMSDDQIRSYAKMMGMPNMDPSMLRNSANMMKNMDQNQFNNMKNAAKNFGPGAGATSTTSTTPTSNTSSTKSQATSSSQPTSSSRYAQVEKLKLKGNDFFKKGSYDEAASSYFEAIIEIEEIRSKNKSLQDDELDTLEVSCRLNYANVKAKLNEFDIVLTQSKAVLNIKENGKAYFRLGQAFFHFNKLEEAIKNLDKAVPLLPGDETVTELRDKAKKALEEKEATSQENGKSTQEEAKTENTTQETQEEKSKEKTETKPKMKKKNAPGVEVPVSTEEAKQSKVEPVPDYLSSQKSKEKEEVTIEEEKVSETKPQQTQQTYNPASGYPPGFTDDKIKKGQEELGKLAPDQLKMMTDYFKNMDNATLKSMLKMQSGMDVSDEQLASMKNMMTPEMLQNFSKMDMSNLPKMPRQQTGTTTYPQATTGTTTATADPTTEPLLGDQPGFPGAGMDLGSDQIQTMLEMVINNPEMLKNMVGMLGENHPIGKLVKNRSPEELAKYMKVIQKLLKVYGKFSPVIKFLKQYWQLIAGALIGYIIYRLTK